MMFNDIASQSNGSNGTLLNGTNTGDTSLSTEKIIICVVFYIVVLITILGNVLVLMSIKVEKRLQTAFNYYIVNLAATDIGVAVTAMSFYTLDVTLGYWPFGEFMCAVWIFCDYGMTFASVFTLIAISVDRFWSVTWSLHYRTHHTRKKCIGIIAIIWLFMVILWLPACLTDRSRNAVPGVCIWEPSLNKEYVIVIAVIGHHGSFAVLMFCYVRVLIFMYKRKVNPLVSRKKPITSASGYMEESVIPSSVSTIPLPAAELSNTKPLPVSKVSNSLRPPQIRPEVELASTGSHTSDGNSTVSSGNRERKVFVTLTYIIVGYVICWLPFHIVFDISAIAPNAVPSTVYTITFWMTYLNSTINPFLYNFSSSEFRQAFSKVLRCN